MREADISKIHHPSNCANQLTPSRLSHYKFLSFSTYLHFLFDFPRSSSRARSLSLSLSLSPSPSPSPIPFRIIATSMESAAVLRSFHYSLGTVSHMRSVVERPGMVPMYNARWPVSSKLHFQGFAASGKLVSYPIKEKGMLVSCVSTSETAVTAKSDVSTDSSPEGALEKNTLQRATFPNGFEALVLEVCDETEVAELQLKVGDFEMHLKRNIVATKAPAVISHTTSPPVSAKPMVESAPTAPPSSPPKSSPEKTSPFINVSLEKSSKLEALEASGSNAYVLVSSPTVGSFRRGRTLKGKKQPPICKEGDIIKEGQVIGFLDQFGTELPVKSDVAGEVLKLLFADGEAVGYGDPLIAVLPSFHGIK